MKQRGLQVKKTAHGNACDQEDNAIQQTTGNLVAVRHSAGQEILI